MTLESCKQNPTFMTAAQIELCKNIRNSIMRMEQPQKIPTKPQHNYSNGLPASADDVVLDSVARVPSADEGAKAIDKAVLEVEMQQSIASR